MYRHCAILYTGLVHTWVLVSTCQSRQTLRTSVFISAPLLVSDITEKVPVAGVRSVTRAARHAGVRGPQTASLAIHFSFSCAPRDSVTAPAQSTTTQTNSHRPARDATQHVTNVTVSVCLCFAYKNGNLRGFPSCVARLCLLPCWQVAPFPKLFLQSLQHWHTLSSLLFYNILAAF